MRYPHIARMASWHSSQATRNTCYQSWLRVSKVCLANKNCRRYPLPMTEHLKLKPATICRRRPVPFPSKSKETSKDSSPFSCMDIFPSKSTETQRQSPFFLHGHLSSKSKDTAKDTKSTETQRQSPFFLHGHLSLQIHRNFQGQLALEIIQRWGIVGAPFLPQNPQLTRSDLTQRFVGRAAERPPFWSAQDGR